MELGRMLRVALVAGTALLSAAVVTTAHPQVAQADDDDHERGEHDGWRGRRDDERGEHDGWGGRAEGWHGRGYEYGRHDGYYGRGGGPVYVQPGYYAPGTVYYSRHRHYRRW